MNIGTVPALVVVEFTWESGKGEADNVALTATLPMSPYYNLYIGTRLLFPFSTAQPYMLEDEPPLSENHYVSNIASISRVRFDVSKNLLLYYATIASRNYLTAKQSFDYYVEYLGFSEKSW